MTDFELGMLLLFGGLVTVVVPCSAFFVLYGLALITVVVARTRLR